MLYIFFMSHYLKKVKYGTIECQKINKYNIIPESILSNHIIFEQPLTFIKHIKLYRYN